MQVKGFQTGAKRLRIGTGISNRDKDISNRARDYKSVWNNLRKRVYVHSSPDFWGLQKKKNRTFPLKKRVFLVKCLFKRVLCIHLPRYLVQFHFLIKIISMYIEKGNFFKKVFTSIQSLLMLRPIL